MDASSDMRRLADGMIALLQRSWRIDQPIGLLRAAVRLLSAGAPVTVPQVALAAGMPAPGVRRVLSQLPDATWTADGRLAGLTITSTPSPYRLSTAGGELYAASAIDALLVPALLEQPVQLSATCYVTGTPIRVDVSAREVVHVEPETILTTVLARPELIKKLHLPTCPRQVLFRSSGAATRWLVGHPSYRCVTIREAFCYAKWLTSG